MMFEQEVVNRAVVSAPPVTAGIASMTGAVELGAVETMTIIWLALLIVEITIRNLWKLYVWNRNRRNGT